MGLGIHAAEKGWVPDALIRRRIRHLLTMRIRQLEEGGVEGQSARLEQLLREMNSAPIALETGKANEQHYEMPSEFMELCLGPRLKYSSCLFPVGNETLKTAEEKMLRLTCERAGLADGQSILELGCGWGSLSLWMAENFPKSKILGISNSKTQRDFILNRARSKGFSNVEIQTVDINVFDPVREGYDRVVSVEMFEHTRNWKFLFQNIAKALKPEGKLFFHIFTHYAHPYAFEIEGDDNWLGKYFFTGGIMPSDSLPLYFQEHLRVEKSWRVNGRHYGQTAECWLENMDEKRDQILEVFTKSFGVEQASLWYQRWRMFYMSCAELWNFREGNEWLVSHYLFNKR